jgi:hypothetical protein
VSGFEFSETMSGSYRLADSQDEERPLSFSVRARSRSWLRFLRDPVMDIEGEVDAEGLADHKHLRGTLGLYLVKDGTLSYAFAFRDNGGRRCAFEGKKRVSLGSLPESMTVLPGRLLREGAPIAEAHLRFDLRGDLVDFVRSFRPVL